MKGSVWNLFTPEAKVTDDIQRSLDEVKSIRKVSFNIKSELQNSLQIKECVTKKLLTFLNLST